MAAAVVVFGDIGDNDDDDDDVVVHVEYVRMGNKYHIAICGRLSIYCVFNEIKIFFARNANHRLTLLENILTVLAVGRSFSFFFFSSSCSLSSLSLSAPLLLIGDMIFFPRCGTIHRVRPVNLSISYSN